MAFIEKRDPVVINIKLTSKGRELLSQGKLNFQYFAIGDSEIDYGFISGVTAIDSEYSAYNSSILRPKDKNPNIISFITKTLNGSPYNSLPSAPYLSYTVENTVTPLGFFSNISSSGATFITDSNHVKQPDAMVDISTVIGGNILTLLKAPTYGTSGQEPAVGDLLLIKWTYGTSSTTGHSLNSSFSTPHLFYKIIGIVDGSGSLGSGSVDVRVDRDLPNFSGYSVSGIYAGASIYYNFINYSGDSIFNMSSTEYLDESVLSFLENSQCPTIIFPFWNMTIIFTEEIAGVTAEKLKFTQFNSRTYGGFVSYIQNQAPIYKKLGVIHYTNSSPANVYGEGLLVDMSRAIIPTVDIPTIMWHKSTTGKLGVKLAPIGSQKLLTGATTGASLNVIYYDLADLDENVVGKVFPDLKIFLIEDQELLFAMSYKSNRTWTLPDFITSMTDMDCPPCP